MNKSSENKFQNTIDRMIVLEGRGEITSDSMEELLKIIDSFNQVMASATDATPAEIARILSERGLALTEAGRVKLRTDPLVAQQFLKQSAASYDFAEQLYEQEDEPLRRAKMNFNYGNTLTLMSDESDGTDIALIEKSLDRFQAARKGFAELAPELVPNADQMIGFREMQLPLARLRAKVEQKVEGYKSLIEEIEESGLESDAQIRERFGMQVRHLREEGVNMSDFVRVVHEVLGPANESEDIPSKLIELLQNTLAKAEGSRSDENKQMSIFIGLLRSRLNQDQAADRVTRYREAEISRGLNILEGIFEAPAETEYDIRRRLGQLRRLMRVFKNYDVKETLEGRAKFIIPMCRALLSDLVDDRMEGGYTMAESARSQKLVTRLEETITCYKNSEPEELIKIERDTLRPVALEFRQFLRRKHTAFTKPVWSVPRSQPKANQVFVSASEEIWATFELGATRLLLKVAKPQSGLALAESRWNMLATSSVVVIDLANNNEYNLADRFYELGMARSLGLTAIVLVTDPIQVSFDVDVIPIVLNDTFDEQDAAAILDMAVFVPAGTLEPSSTEPTVEYVRRQWSELRISRHLDDVKDDPLELTTVLEQLNTELGTSKHLIFYPPWQPVYEGLEPSCFHVTPYRPDWFESVRVELHRACKVNGVNYLVGLEGSERKIIHSIWQDVGRSRFIVADLTGLTANAAYELGMADALGREVMIITQGEDSELFPMISKLRVHFYNVNDMAGLRAAFSRFLG